MEQVYQNWGWRQDWYELEGAGDWNHQTFTTEWLGNHFLFEDGMNCIGFKMQSLAALVQLGSWFYKN